MAEYNPIRIEDFPELTSLLSTDQVILFKRQSGNLMPYVVELSAFSEYIVRNGELEDVSSLLNIVENQYKTLERNLKLNYMTPKEVKDMYSTKKDLSNVINLFEKTKDFDAATVNKATNDYVENQAANVLRSIQGGKRVLGSAEEDELASGSKAMGYKIVLGGYGKTLTMEEEPG